MAVKVFSKEKPQENVFLTLRESNIGTVHVSTTNEYGTVIKNILEVSEDGVLRCANATGNGIITECGKVVIKN